MCCARTAALQGEEKSLCKCQYGFPAAFNAVYTCKRACTKKTSPNRVQEPPKYSLDPSGNLQNRPRSRIWQPRGSQEHRSCAQDTPNSHPRAPKNAPGPSKSHPRDTQEAPKPFPNRFRHAPGRHFQALLTDSSVQKAVGSFLACFLRCALDGRHAFRIGFSNTKRLSGPFRIGGACAHKNLEKSSLGASKTDPQASPDPPKSCWKCART